MDQTRHFDPAPWSTALKVTSSLGTVLVLGVGIAAYRAIPTPAGFTHHFGLAVALVFPVMLVFCLLFTVNGYAVSPSHLEVVRLLWSTKIPLAGLSRVWIEPSVCKGALRIFGNGGLFSFTGLYQNSRLGRFRLFVTDFKQPVVLSIAGRTVVISPASPQAFVEHIHDLFPATRPPA